MNFKERSNQKELLDDPAIPFADISRNMHELDVINTWLGGHGITIEGIKQLIRPEKDNESKTWHICEIGCGGADNLRVISNWCMENNIRIILTGIDINPNCIDVAKSRPILQPSTFIISDYKQVRFEDMEQDQKTTESSSELIYKKPDIIFSSLFCHHFSNEELVSMLKWMNKNSKTGFLINDLHRHPLAYYSIKLITTLFSRSYLVKNDAPISVLKGFRKNEWTKLLDQAGIGSSHICWKWAFRWLVVSRAEPDKQTDPL